MLKANTLQYLTPYEISPRINAGDLFIYVTLSQNVTVVSA